MDAVILHNPVWEYKRGLVIKQDSDFVVVRIPDKYQKDWIYDLKVPRNMVKLTPTIAEA